jgi:hypothetical protein
MDMKKLLEAVTKFSGEEVGQKPGDQVRGTDKAKKGTKEHPFKGRLVGDSKDNMLKGLAQIAEDTSIERKLAERWAEFKEALLGIEERRPTREGARPPRGHKPQERYKKIKEYGADNNTPKIADPEAAKKAMVATNQLKQATGSPAPAANIMKALDAASQGKNIDANNAKVLEPTMDIIQKAATDPKLASQFKQLAQQAKTV